MAVAPVSDTSEIKIRVALVCSAYLIDDVYLSLRHPLVSSGTKEVLSVDEWVPYEVGGAHHRNEILGLHIWEALVANHAVVHLSIEGQF